MKQFSFPLVLNGYGETAEAARNDAVEGFALDPGPCPDPEECQEANEIEEPTHHPGLAEAKMTPKFFCVVMVGGLDPVVYGPYGSEEALTTQVKTIHTSLKDADNLFGMAIDHQGSPEVWTYSNGFFAEDL